MTNKTINQDYHLFRSILSQSWQYRERVFQLVRNKLKKPAAQVSLALVGTLILIAFLGVAVLRPTLLTISSLIKEIQDEQKFIKALEDISSSLVKAHGFLEEMKDDLPKIDWAFPSGQEFEIFTKEVEILAKEKGLAVIEISQDELNLIEKNIKNNRKEVLEVKVEVGGNEDAVKNFLADLIKMDRLVLFKSVDISSISKDQRRDEQYQVKATARIEILYYSEN